MEDLKFLGRGLKLTGIIGINPLDLTPTTIKLESFAGFLVAFVLDRVTSNKARIQVLNVHGVFESVDAVFLTLFIGDQVISSDQLAPFLRLTFIRSLEMPFSRHFAFTAILTILVERLMSQQMPCGLGLFSEVCLLFVFWPNLGRRRHSIGTPPHGRRPISTTVGNIANSIGFRSPPVSITVGNYANSIR